MNIKLRLLSLLREVLEDKGLRALATAQYSTNADEVADASAVFYRKLTESGCETASQYLARCLQDRESVFSRAAAEKQADVMLARADAELKILKEFIECASATVAAKLPKDAQTFFPTWKSGTFSVTARNLADDYAAHGYGAVRSPAVLFDETTHEFVPILSTSAIKLSDLKEYEQEKNAAVQNTLAFLCGNPANNILFYGDRGTGKSSTVHALLNEFYPRGLRLLQITKSAIPLFPVIKQKLACFPHLRFVIFLDDLSFEENDGSFAALKAALEGSLATARNALIYATTNRRHLVKESLSARDGDDVHTADTMEEQLSLFDRFGLVITYIAPDKREYLAILRQILADRNISMPDDEISLLAERFAIKKGGRSPRAAKQLADMIESGMTDI